VNELEIIQHRQIEGLSIFINTVDYRTAHVHSEWELIWVLDQPLSVTCGTKSFQAAPGQMMLFSPNEPHEFHKVEESCTFLCLQISPKILPAMPHLQVEEYLLYKFLCQEEELALKQDLAKLMESYLLRKEKYELYCVGQSHMILYRLLTKVPVRELTPGETVSIDKRNARLKRLIRFVDENYMQKIRLADFAQMENCSLSYLSRFVKDTLNQNFQAYVTSVRFNCACKLIAAGEKKMLDVCMESGFSDYRYFSREFQKQYGMTPEQYSQFAQKRHLEKAVVRHSLHSVERFYSREESLKILKNYL